MMKNVQIIDGAENCAYDVFSISEESFEKVFPDGQNIEFIEDLIHRLGEKETQEIIEPIWQNRVRKDAVNGIHGTLFYGLQEKRRFYPNKKDADLHR